MKICIFLGILLLFFIKKSSCVSIGLNQYEYMKRRDDLKNYELQFKKAFTLNNLERVVNLYFKYLKSKEFIQTKDFFYPARPVENELERIKKREIYKFLKRMPKGGNLHYHESQGLNRNFVLDIVMQSPDTYDMLYICDQEECEERYRLTFFKYASNATKSWTKVKGSSWTKEEIVKKTTLAGIFNSRNINIYATDTVSKWKLTGDIFNFYDDIVTYNGTRYLVLKKTLDSALIDEYTQILEFRRSVSKSPWYFLDDGSKKLIDVNEEMNVLKQFKKDYISQNPSFIDFVFLIYATRSNNKQSISDNVERVMKIQAQQPEMIRGYDLVGEEDTGHTLLFHADSLMRVYNKTLNSNGTFHFFFHTAETNWPEDNEPSQFGDEVATNENVYDSLVLETKRIGHGLGFAKHPALLNLLKERGIAVELCPTSNQILGYTPDLRNHPGIQFFRNGVPVVLAGDDPGAFGYNELTVEYYMVAMAWGLDLSEMKQIAFNSINYSSIPEETKASGILKFYDLWQNVFIKEQYNAICNMTFNTVYNISGVMPTFGPFDGITNVSVFGYGFENALCKDIICQFGSYNTTGYLHDYHEIKCPTPLIGIANFSATIKLVVNNRIIDTGFEFKFFDMWDGSVSISCSLHRAKIIHLLFVFLFVNFWVAVIHH